MINLIIGGAKSGKSLLAEQSLADEKYIAADIHYIATAEVSDPEMQIRISKHQGRRPKSWNLHEVPLDLISKLAELDKPQSVILIDCLTLWLNNLLYYRAETDFSELFERLIAQLKSMQADVYIVSNEVGLGIIPLGQVTRQFVDLAGHLNQQVAQVAHTVNFMVAGIPWLIKGE